MMIHVLSRVTIDALPRFLETFSTRGLEARRRFGSAGSQVFQELSDERTVCVLLTWDSAEAFERFAADPEVRQMMQDGGIQGTPESTLLTKVAEFEH
jgi:heme-degrading monooxygenase HmoA